MIVLNTLGTVFDPPNILFVYPMQRVKYYIYAWIFEKSLLTSTQWDQLGEVGVMEILRMYYALLASGKKSFSLIGDEPSKNGYDVLNALKKNKTYDFAKYLAVLKALAYSVKYGQIEGKYLNPTNQEIIKLSTETQSTIWDKFTNVFKQLSYPVVLTGGIVAYFLIKPYFRK